MKKNRLFLFKTHFEDIDDPKMCLTPRNGKTLIFA